MNTYVKRGGSRKKQYADKGAKKKQNLKLEEFIAARDYTGAVVLLEFQRKTKDAKPETLQWLGYAAFHNGEYPKALAVYEELCKKPETPKEYHLYKACCLFYMGEYNDAESTARQGPPGSLQNRLLFHCAHKQGDESKLMQYHQKVSDNTEDQLCLASIHYLRSHYQESTEIYKRLLIEHREYLALQVYVALCYYKLDYYDVSLELLGPYLTAHQDSAIAINLKACNHYKLYDGKAAEAELKGMMDVLSASSQNLDNALLRHNTVVFRKGENALQILPPLIDTIPEARLNLVIYHLDNNEINEAHDLIKDLDPSTPQEYILKGVVNACLGQDKNTQAAGSGDEHLKFARQFFQLVGSSQSECDTIPGRQCMASCFFLLKQFEDVLIYLNSVKAYSIHDNGGFAYNYGVALASVGNYKEAEDSFVTVTDEEIKNDYSYLSWLARCFIYNGKARDAWELYLKMESNTDSFAMLVVISGDCYKVGSFFYAAKAYDVLERLDPGMEHWEGKQGACCGVLQQVIAKKEKRDRLKDVIGMLQNNATNPQAELMIRVMNQWLNSN